RGRASRDMDVMLDYLRYTHCGSGCVDEIDVGTIDSVEKLPDLQVFRFRHVQVRWTIAGWIPGMSIPYSFNAYLFRTMKNNRQESNLLMALSDRVQVLPLKRS